MRDKPRLLFMSVSRVTLNEDAGSALDCRGLRSAWSAVAAAIAFHRVPATVV
jgi:hypothetical protein